MGWINNKLLVGATLFLSSVLLAGCTVSYGFTGGSIDYSRIKTISIADFPIRADYVYAPLGTVFNDELKDIFIRQTRLQVVPRNGDLELEGEITEYRQYNESVAADGYSSQTKLVVTVNVRYVNNKNPEENIDGQAFSSSRTYDSSQLLTAVQDQYISEMVKDITDQIFNATVANW